MHAAQNWIQPLEWDSNLLGVNVAKILPATMSSEQLVACITELRQQKIQLAYWLIASEDQNARKAAEQVNAILADHKLTYVCEHTSLNQPQLNTTDLKIFDAEIYSPKLPDAELTDLAYASGMYSRFRNDPNLSEDQFKAVYREWMNNSTKRLVAQDVIVIRQQEASQQPIIGMVTVGEKNQRGDIGLLAVAEAARSQGIGSKLVRAAQTYFIQRGYAHSQVVTQQENKAACRLYEKCGYQIDKLEYFYHIWVA